MWSIMVPGRNNIVACDSGGRAFGIEIQEGNGDIRNYLIDLGDPVMRNSWGHG